MPFVGRRKKLLRSLTAFLISALALVACVAPKHPVVGYSETCVIPAFDLHCDVDFSHTEQISILYAALGWNAVTGGSIRPVFDLDFSPSSIRNAYILIRVKSLDSIVNDADQESGAKVLGFTISAKSSHVSFLVVDRMSDEIVLNAVAAHEIGHLMGLALTSHPSDPYALMHGSYTGLNTHLTATDVLLYQKELCHGYR